MPATKVKLRNIENGDRIVIKDATGLAEVNELKVLAGGISSTGLIIATSNSNDEGGEIQLRAALNGTKNFSIDNYQDTLRVFNNTDGVIAYTISANGQVIFFNSISVGTTPFDCAVLSLHSTSKGLLLPRLTTSQRDAISSPVDGLQIYNTTTNKFQGRAAGAWVDLH